MLSLSGNTRFFFVKGSTDMRKGFEGLIYLVESFFEGELMSGSYFLFLNRRCDRMKILFWDSDGFVIWYKRLEKGSFSKEHLKNRELDRKQFMMLLEGITPKKIQSRYTFS